MYKNLHIIFLFLCASHIACAEKLSGRIFFEDGVSAAGVIVSLKASDGKMLTFTYTDKEGYFFLDIEDADGIFLEAAFLGYESIRLDPPFIDNISLTLKKTALSLDEVVVKAENVMQRGDTISYSVPSLASQNDRTLVDILKKIPGIEVDRKGYVQYQGKPISRFYIEGNDLLGEKYNVATVNLDPEYLGSIQIYERHQPVKVLEGFDSATPDNAALNITLKQGVRSKWLGTLEAQAGVSSDKPRVPYSAGGMLMNISRRFQTMTTVETDAAGNDIIRNSMSETTYNPDNYEFSKAYRVKDFLGISSPSAPLDDERTMFNTSYSAQTSNKVVLKEGYSLGVAVDYENLSLSMENTNVQTIFNADGSVLSDYTGVSINKSGMWYGSADLRFDINTTGLYLKERLKFSMRGLSAGNSITGTSVRNEDTQDKDVEVLNSLAFMKRTPNNRSVLSFSMLTQYSDKTEILKVSAEDSQETGRTEAVQSVSSEIFYNDLYFNYRFILADGLELISRTDVNIEYRNFGSAFEGAVPEIQDIFPEIPFSGGSSMMMIEPLENLSLSYITRKLRLGAGVDIRYRYYDYFSVSKYHRFAANPRLNIGYEVTPRFRIQATGAFSLSSIDDQELYGTVIMNDFRNFTVGRTELIQTPSYSATIDMNFKSPLSGWYVRGYGSYLYSKSFEYVRYVAGDYIVSQHSNQTTPFNAVTAGLKVEKGFLGNGSKLSADIFINWYESQMSQNNNGISYQYYSGNAVLAYTGSPVRWMKMGYEGMYSISSYKSEGVWSDSFVHYFRQRLQLAFFPTERMEIGASFEHYLSKYAGLDVNQTYLLDLSMGYNVTKSIKVFVNARNLLDNDRYTYSYVSPLQSFVQYYIIRPLNVLLGLSFRF